MASFFNQIVLIVSLGAGTLKNEHIVGGKVDDIEAEGLAGRGQVEGQIGTGPVDHRHEVVTDRLDSGLRDEANVGLEVLRIRVRVFVAQLDGVVNRKAFDHGPAQACSRDLVSTGLNSVAWPDFTRVMVMQSGDNARRASLFYVG